MGSALTTSSIDEVVTGLTPETTYHYRVVATNQSGTLFGPDHTFTTFPFTEILKDPCPNAHVRQQVGAALLPDCRAYELVSAPDTGGYDVESPLVPNREPFGGYPDAQGRALYGIHSGAIPGPWNPTNRGVDPYLATRGQDGWTTEYVGIPADNPFAAAPFSSTLDEANATLATLAFSGDEICSPCFEDGSTGPLSVRLTGRSSRGCREASPRRRASAPMGSFANASPPTGPTSSSDRPRSSQKAVTMKQVMPQSTTGISKPASLRWSPTTPTEIPSHAFRGPGIATLRAMGPA